MTSLRCLRCCAAVVSRLRPLRVRCLPSWMRAVMRAQPHVYHHPCTWMTNTTSDARRNDA